MQKISLSKYKIFLFCLIFFILGILITSFFNLMSFEFILFVCIILCLIGITFLKNKKNLVILFLFVLSLFFGMWRYIISLPINNIDQIQYYNGQNVVLEGIINKNPGRGIKSQQLEIENININNKNINGKLLVATDLYPKFNYGDRLRLKCSLEEPSDFEGFSYQRYLARYNLYSICFYPKIDALETDQGNVFYAQVFKIKNKLQNIINRSLEEPEAGLLSAMILGEKKAINEDLRVIFSCTGLSHIIAISGMHISILSFLLIIFLVEIGFSRKCAYWVLLFFYFVLIGAPASAVRAGFMGAMVGFAFLIGRIGKAMNVLLFTAFVLLMINPKLLRDDIGFQLSFLAISGIIIFYPIIEKYSAGFNFLKYKPIRDILNMTVCAQILTWPFIVYYFSFFFIFWLCGRYPAIIVFSMFALLLSWILPFFSILLFVPVYFLLKYIVVVASVLEKIPFVCPSLNQVNIFYFLSYYFLLLIFYLKIKKSRKGFF